MYFLYNNHYFRNMHMQHDSPVKVYFYFIKYINLVESIMI